MLSVSQKAAHKAELKALKLCLYHAAYLAVWLGPLLSELQDLLTSLANAAGPFADIAYELEDIHSIVQELALNFCLYMNHSQKKAELEEAIEAIGKDEDMSSLYRDRLRESWLYDMTTQERASGQTGVLTRLSSQRRCLALENLSMRPRPSPRLRVLDYLAGFTDFLSGYCHLLAKDSLVKCQATPNYNKGHLPHLVSSVQTMDQLAIDSALVVGYAMERLWVSSPQSSRYRLPNLKKWQSLFRQARERVEKIATLMNMGDRLPTPEKGVQRDNQKDMAQISNLFAEEAGSTRVKLVSDRKLMFSQTHSYSYLAFLRQPSNRGPANRGPAVRVPTENKVQTKKMRPAGNGLANSVGSGEYSGVTPRCRR